MFTLFWSYRRNLSGILPFSPKYPLLLDNLLLWENKVLCLFSIAIQYKILPLHIFDFTSTHICRNVFMGRFLLSSYFCLLTNIFYPPQDSSSDEDEAGSRYSSMEYDWLAVQTLKVITCESFFDPSNSNSS